MCCVDMLSVVHVLATTVHCSGEHSESGLSTAAQEIIQEGKETTEVASSLHGCESRSH